MRNFVLAFGHLTRHSKPVGIFLVSANLEDRDMIKALISFGNHVPYRLCILRYCLEKEEERKEQKPIRSVWNIFFGEGGADRTCEYRN